MPSLADLVFRIREHAAGRSDLMVRGTEALSASDVVGNIHSLVLALDAGGLKAGQRVAVVAGARPDWPTIDLACAVLGAVSVPLDPSWPAASLGGALRNAGVHWLLYEQRVRKMIAGLVPSLATQPRLVALDQPDELAGTQTLTRLIGKHAERRGAIPLGRFRGRAKADAPATIIYARTRRPEGLVLSHRVLMAAHSGVLERLTLERDDRVLNTLPIYETVQRLIGLASLEAGASLLFLPGSEEDGSTELFSTTSSHLPTVACVDAVKIGQMQTSEDSLFQTAAASAEGKKRRRPTLRLVISSGPLSADLHDAVLGTGAETMQSVSVAGTVLTLDLVAPLPAGAVGRSIAGVTLRAGDRGQIFARGPAVSEMIWQRDDEGSLIGSDGWLRTGLRGTVDPAGFLVLHGDEAEEPSASSITSM